MKSRKRQARLLTQKPLLISTATTFPPDLFLTCGDSTERSVGIVICRVSHVLIKLYGKEPPCCVALCDLKPNLC